VTRALLALFLVTAWGCKQPEPDYTGIGKWRFGTSTLASVDYAPFCQATDLSDGRKATWCFNQTPFKIGTRTAEVDVYFLGTDKNAPLIEIQLLIRGCSESELDQWMRTAFGPPISTRTGRGYWQNKHLWAAALMPSEPGRCRVHMLPLSESGEIQRIKLL
jgi:hypothetical protein